MTTTPLPAARQSARRSPPGARRVGYAIGAGVNAALLWLALVRPGWRAAPFVTEEATAVLGLVIVAWFAGVVVNLLYLAWDPPGLKRLGDAVSGALACAVALQLLTVFPFDFAGSVWETVARVVLVVAVVAAGISVIVNVVTLIVRPWDDTAERR